MRTPVSQERWGSSSTTAAGSTELQHLPLTEGGRLSAGASLSWGQGGGGEQSRAPQVPSLTRGETKDTAQDTARPAAYTRQCQLRL